MLIALLTLMSFGQPSFAAQYCSSHTEPRSGLECGQCPMIKMPCDLASLKDIPRLVFVTETHNLKEAQTVRNALLVRSIRGEIPLASETTDQGPLLPWFKQEGNPASAPLLHGLESHLPYAVTLSYLTQNEYVLSDRPRRTERLFDKLKGYISTFPLFRDGFSKVKGLPSLKGKSSTEIEAKVLELVDRKQVEAFAKELHLAILELANDPNGPIRCFLGNQDLRPLLTPEDRATVGLLKPAPGDEDFNLGEIMEDNPLQTYDVYRVFYSVRNREFARTTAELICRYSGQHPRIYVNVGESHVNRMTGLWLMQMTDGRVKQIDLFNSHKPEDVKELMKLIEGPTAKD